MNWLLFLVSFVVVIFLAGGYLLFEMVFDRRFPYPRVKDGLPVDPHLAPSGPQLILYNEEKKKAFRQINFTTLEITSFDGLKLKGNLLKGADGRATIICVHGYKSSPEGDFCAIIDIYLQKQFNILLVEDRAHCRSEGRYVGYGETDRFDVLAWTNKIAELFPDTNIFLHGMSMGGATVLHTADMVLPHNVKGIISDCGFTSINEITKHLIGVVYKIPYFPLGYIAAGFSAVIAKVPFNRSDSIKCLSNTKIPVVIISGIDDQYVPCEMTRRLYDACASEKHLLLVEGAGHAASYMLATRRYTEMVTSFIDRLIEK